LPGAPGEHLVLAGEFAAQLREFDLGLSLLLGNLLE